MHRKLIEKKKRKVWDSNSYEFDTEVLLTDPPCAYSLIAMHTFGSVHM